MGAPMPEITFLAYTTNVDLAYKRSRLLYKLPLVAHAENSIGDVLELTWDWVNNNVIGTNVSIAIADDITMLDADYATSDVLNIAYVRKSGIYLYNGTTHTKYGEGSFVGLCRDDDNVLYLVYNKFSDLTKYFYRTSAESFGTEYSFAASIRTNESILSVGFNNSTNELQIVLKGNKAILGNRTPPPEGKLVMVDDKVLKIGNDLVMQSGV